MQTIIISNGFHKFHLTSAASELFRRGILSLLITGAYPRHRTKALLKKLRADRLGSIERLIDRRDDHLDDQLVTGLWGAEMFNQLAGVMLRSEALKRYYDVLEGLALRLYSRHAEGVLRHAQGKIYHYRAGFGHGSVGIARRRGMIALCDHSAVHPALFDYLVAHDGRFPPRGQGGYMSPMWRSIQADIDQADYVVVNSDFAKETFLHQGWNPARLHVIYLGVDQKFLDALPRRLASAGDGTLRFLFAGSFGRHKGADAIVSAFCRIDDFPWRLELVRNVEPETRSRHASFLRDPRVHLAGTVPRHEVAARMSAADVFVFPSLSEGSARVVFEAMAGGCYVITTPNSGSIVREGVHGALVPPSNADALEHAIRACFVERERVAMIGRANAALIREQYNQGHYGDNLCRLYEQLLGKPLDGWRQPAPVEDPS